MKVAISKLRTSEVRGTVPQMELLKENILKNGLIHPIEVAITNDGFTVLHGTRRVEAYRQLGITSIEATVMQDDRYSQDDIG